MTSNLGSERIREQIDTLDGELDEAAELRMKNDLMGLLKQRMRPEFLNRIDEVVLFHPLGRDQIRAIVEIQFAHIRDLAARSHHITLELTEAAMDWLAEKGFDPVFGARPLKRVLQRHITNKLAEELLSGWIQAGERLRIDRAPDGEGVVFETLADVEVVDEGR